MPKNPDIPDATAGCGLYRPRVARYLAESFVPRASARDRDLGQTAVRARAEAEQLTREGARVHLLQAIFVPEDETCFLLYEAASAELVTEVSRRISLSCERIVEALEVGLERPLNTPQASEPGR
jgi:hypothetical protein